MFEDFDRNFSDAEKLRVIVEGNSDMRNFLTMYLQDPNRIISPYRILRMFRYFKVEKSYKMSEVKEDLGVYAAKRMIEVRLSCFKPPKRRQMEIRNFVQLWYDLRKNVRHLNQYLILRNFFFYLSDVDIIWCTRFLCHKTKIPAEVVEVLI